MSEKKLGPQGFPLTPSLSKAERKAFFGYQDHRRDPKMQRRYVERTLQKPPGS